MNYFNIGMPNLTYRSQGQDQDFSQCTLTNMGYFWDISCRVYCFRMGKNGRKTYNFDDPALFGDDAAEADLDDEQPIGTSHGVSKGDVVFQDATHGDAHGNNFGVVFGDTSSITNMLQNTQLGKDERYEEDSRRRDAFEANQV